MVKECEMVKKDVADPMIGLHDFGAERHDGAQHWDGPKDEKHTGWLHPSQPLKLDQECD